MKLMHAIVMTALITTGCSSKAPKACSPPRPSWGKPRPISGEILSRIAIDRAGRTYFNGKQIPRATLDKYLALGTSMNPEPWILLETEMGASCSAVEAVRDQVEKHVDCSTGYRCNEGIMDVWEHMSVPPGTKPS